MTQGAGSTEGEVVEREYIKVTFQRGFPQQTGINGCRVENVIEVAIDRLRQYQEGPLACPENAEALEHLAEAVRALQQRTQRRREQGVLNTMTPHEATRTEDEVEDFSATGS